MTTREKEAQNGELKLLKSSKRQNCEVISWGEVALERLKRSKWEKIEG